MKLRCLTGLFLAVCALPIFASQPHAVDMPSSDSLMLDGSVRITSPGGLVLHQRIPEGTSFDTPFRFQVNAPKKGLNGRDFSIHGEIAMGGVGSPVFRGQCLEVWTRPQGKMVAVERRSTPFGGSLVHGRHVAPACQAVLVQVVLP